MTRRERVRAALRFEPVDKTPKDLAGMRSTGISAFAYPDLIKALGLPPRRPRVYDTGQMLALPEVDVLDALDCDLVTVEGNLDSSALDEPEKWEDFDFGGRLPAQVHDASAFSVEDDGAVRNGDSVMVPGSYVFDSPHGGHELDLSGELRMPDVEQTRRRLERGLPTAGQVQEMAEYVSRVRDSTDRAIFYCAPAPSLGFPYGFPNWSMVCLTEPDYVHAYHTVIADYAVKAIERVAPAIHDMIDVYMCSADDQGLQDRTILPPHLFKELYVPYYARINEALARTAPGVTRFLHSCGAVYDLIDDFVDSGFQALNPVQWTAGDHTPQEWRARAGSRIVLWGGGVNTQGTLPFGTVDDVRREVKEVAGALASGSGYVFCAIHNILAEVSGEKVVAMYNSVP